MDSSSSSPTLNEAYVTMFAGKGGVGKTTCAAATALHYASLGEEALVISTDPTPSLSHIFEVRDRQKPVKVSEGLYLAELGMDEVKQMWDEKFGREVYEVFSSFVSVSYERFADFITSVLPGLSDEFTVDYIKGLAQRKRYARIVWDTAPLGQTLGLLQTPSMLGRHLKPAPRIYSRLKIGRRSRRPILKILEQWAELSSLDVSFIREEVEFNLVTIPEALAVEQLDRIFEELARHGLRLERIIVNNVVRDPDSPFLEEKASAQRGYLDAIRAKAGGIPVVELPLFSREVRGEALERMATLLYP